MSEPHPIATTKEIKSIPTKKWRKKLHFKALAIKTTYNKKYGRRCGW
jgi:hypothetical protein